jgi:tRNA-splicing ligase RtcB (3'-phosphate/5'-hydroxy nucleic acid ligase)
MEISEENYAYLVGKVMGDGHIDKNHTVKLVGQKEDLIQIKEYFDLPSKIYKKEGYSISYYLNLSVKIGRLLSAKGTPIGKKTIIQFLVPNWILNGTDKVKKMFLQGILEDELTTIKIEKKTYSIKPQFKMSKSKELLSNHRLFLSQIKSLIEEKGIECSKISDPKRKKDQTSWDLYFCLNRNKKNILKFEKNIGFRFNKMKKLQLEECVKILRASLKSKPL